VPVKTLHSPGLHQSEEGKTDKSWKRARGVQERTELFPYAVSLDGRLVPVPRLAGRHTFVFVRGTMLQAGRSRFRFPIKSLYFSIYLILPGGTMALCSTQPLTEMSSRNLPGGKGRLARKTTLPPSVSRLSTDNVGASTSHNPMGLHGLLQG
jgi:hypothetical protein